MSLTFNSQLLAATGAAVICGIFALSPVSSAQVPGRIVSAAHTNEVTEGDSLQITIRIRNTSTTAWQSLGVGLPSWFALAYIAPNPPATESSTTTVAPGSEDTLVLTVPSSALGTEAGTQFIIVEASAHLSNVFPGFYAALEVAPPTMVTLIPLTRVLLSNTTLAENRPAGSYVGSLEMVAHENTNAFTYAFAAGPGDDDNAAFSISGTNLLSTTAFNFETASNRYVRLEGFDPFGALTQSVFTVSILDDDETPLVSGLAMTTNGPLALSWTSVTNHSYDILTSFQPAGPFVAAYTNIPATPPTNRFDISPGPASQGFWKVSTTP